VGEVAEMALSDGLSSSDAAPVEDEELATVNLFSRAASGMDAFTKLLTGSNSDDQGAGGSSNDKDLRVLRPAQMEETLSEVELVPSVEHSIQSFGSTAYQDAPSPSNTNIKEASEVPSAANLFLGSPYPPSVGSFGRDNYASTVYLGAPAVPGKINELVGYA